MVDNLGNIVQEVVGAGGDALSQIVGNFKVSSSIRISEWIRWLTPFQLNMTEVEGTIKQVGQGLTQKTYKYDALGSLVDIITNAAGMSFLLTSSFTTADICSRPSRASRCAETVWWRWKRRRRIKHCPPIQHTDAGHPVQQVARDSGTVDIR